MFTDLEDTFYLICMKYYEIDINLKVLVPLALN